MGFDCCIDDCFVLVQGFELGLVGELFCLLFVGCVYAWVYCLVASWWFVLSLWFGCGWFSSWFVV